MTERRCIAVAKCRAPQIDNTDGCRYPAAVAAEGAVCEECARHARRCTTELLTDYDLLHQALGDKHTGLMNDRVARTPSNVLPLNTTVEAKMVEICAYVGLAAKYVEQRTSRIPPRERDKLLGDLAWLWPHFDELLKVGTRVVVWWGADGEDYGQIGRGKTEQLWSGADVALRLGRVHDSVRGVLGTRLSDGRRRYHLPCPRCGSPTLGRNFGSDEITCTSCPPGSRGWNEREYGQLQGMLLWDGKEQAN